MTTMNAHWKGCNLTFKGVKQNRVGYQAMVDVSASLDSGNVQIESRSKSRSQCSHNEFVSQG